VPPIGAPSWCLSEEALTKFNRPTDDIPIYDYDTEEHNDSENDISGEDHNDDSDILNDNESRRVRKRKANGNVSREDQKRKKRKKSLKKKRRESKRSNKK